VYIEAHPRRIATHRDSSRPLKSFNPFTFNRFRTLLYQWAPATPFGSTVCGLFPLQWGCIPPFAPQGLSLSLPSNGNAFISLPPIQLRSLSFTTRGVHPPSTGSRIKMKPESTSRPDVAVAACPTGMPGFPTQVVGPPHKPGESPALHEQEKEWRREVAATKSGHASEDRPPHNVEVFGVAARVLFRIIGSRSGLE
jgi:hypothetical protein